MKIQNYSFYFKKTKFNNKFFFWSLSVFQLKYKYHTEYSIAWLWFMIEFELNYKYTKYFRKRFFHIIFHNLNNSEIHSSKTIKDGNEYEDISCSCGKVFYNKWR